MSVAIRVVNPTNDRLEEYALEQKILSNNISTIEEAILENKTNSSSIFTPKDEKFRKIIQSLDSEKEYYIQYIWSGIDVYLRYEYGELEEIVLFGTEILPKPNEETIATETLFPSYVDDWGNYGEVKVYGTLTKNKHITENLLSLLSQEQYDNLGIIISSVEVEEWESQENFELLQEQEFTNSFITYPVFPIDNLEDFKKDALVEINSIFDSTDEIEIETNAFVKGLELVEKEENRSIARIFFDKHSYQVYRGILKDIMWSPFGNVLMPTAIVDYNYGEILIPLYSPKVILITEAQIGEPFYFSNGDLIGNIPLTNDGIPAVTAVDLLNY